MASEFSARLGFDYVMAAQAQKHVTVNETFRKLDALVQAIANSRTIDDQPLEPEEGDAYLLPASRTGDDWALMSEHSLAVFRDNEWTEILPINGLRLWLVDEAELLVFDGTNWTPVIATISELQNLTQLGIGTGADSANPFSAKLNSALWTALESGAGGSGDLRYTLNKEASPNVLSVLMQSGYSGRAEIGLIGDEELLLKTSSDGSHWNETLRASPDVVAIGTAQGLEVSAINGEGPAAPRNLIINGDFRVAQRGTEFLSPSAGDYLLDRWMLFSASGMTCEFSQEQFAPGQADVPGEPSHYLQWRLQGTASGNPWIEQRIENVRCLPEGKGVLSLYARASRTIIITARVRRHFGSGGSSTEEVDRQAVSLNTAWQKHEIVLDVLSLSGKTLGEGNYISVEFYLSNGETDADIDLADIQLERGQVATPFERQPLYCSLQACQRYFAKTYAANTRPGEVTAIGALATSTNGPSNTAIFDWRLPIEMRASPVIDFYSPATGAIGSADAGGTDIAVTALYGSTSALAAQTVSHSGVDITRLHVVADAEL